MDNDSFDPFLDNYDEDFGYWLNWDPDGPADPTPPDGCCCGHWERKDYEPFDYSNGVYPWYWVEDSY